MIFDGTYYTYVQCIVYTVRCMMYHRVCSSVYAFVSIFGYKFFKSDCLIHSIFSLLDIFFSLFKINHFLWVDFQFIRCIERWCLSVYLICWRHFSSFSLFIKSYLYSIHSMRWSKWIVFKLLGVCVIMKFRTINRVSTKTFCYHDDLPNDKIINRQKWFYCILFSSGSSTVAKKNLFQRIILYDDLKWFVTNGIFISLPPSCLYWDLAVIHTIICLALHFTISLIISTIGNTKK